MADKLSHREIDIGPAHSDIFESHTVRTPTIQIHYLRRPGSAPTLIGLHGLFGSGACLLPLAEALDVGIDIVLPDSRGHGQTEAPERGYLYSDLAHDVIELIAGLDLHRPILLGHSMGGMTACLAAAQMGGQLGGVILIDPTFLDPDYQREVFESGVDRGHQEQLQTPRADLLAQAAARSADRPLRLREALVDARLRTDIRAVQVLTPPNPEFQALLAKVDVPTLLITGSNGIVSKAVAEALQRLNPLVALEHLSGAGHGMPYDAPKEVASLVGAFLRGVVAGDRPSL